VRLTQLASAAPLFDEQGRVRGAVGAFLDISARVLAERQRDALLAGMADGLKNPMAALIWIAEALQQRATEPDEVRLLDRFVQGARQILVQINEFVDMTLAQLRQPPELEWRRVDLAALVTRLAAEQAQVSQGIRIRVEGAGEPLPGLYDEARLARALTQVLDNAVKYSGPGGEVTVSLACAEGATGSWATIRVADRGVGIPSAEVGRVFEPFYRASNAWRTEGAGVGLAGARQAVEAHGGSVDLESEEGVGTTVTMRLPHRPPISEQGAATVRG
jgi:signal transduction histidine kinase